jgi:demethylmenaquinone methyltransferase/2-methoxy-6-polyprenyl-1,4-benzoquinol methylase
MRFTLKIGNLLQTPASKKYYNEQVFSVIAPRYDFITRALSFGQDARWKQDLVQALPGLERPFCIDLACGTGDIARLLAEKYPEGAIMGVDITEAMLDIARERTASPHIFFSRQDMSQLQASSASFDIVTGGYALRNAPDLGVLLSEIHRVLKPGSTAAFLDFSKPADKTLQRIEYWILRFWTSFWGIFFHRNHEVYSYVAESLGLYPDRNQLKELIQSAGFSITLSQTYFFGITELIVFQKKKETNAP